MLKKIFPFIIIISLLSVTQIATAEIFTYNDASGDRYQQTTFYKQVVFYDNIYLTTHDRKYIMNLEVTEKNMFGAVLEGDYLHYTKIYQTVDPYKLMTEEDQTTTKFIRNQNGQQVFERRYHYPVKRNILVFPEEELQIGDSWEGNGTEVHEFGEENNPYYYPIEVHYKYMEDIEWKGKECALIRVTYYLDYNSGQPLTPYLTQDIKEYPFRMKAIYEGYWCWYKKGGYPIFYESETDLIMVLSNGIIHEFYDIEYGEIIKLTDEEPEINDSTEPVTPETIEDSTDDENKNGDEQLDEYKDEIIDKLADKDLPYKVSKGEGYIRINLGNHPFDSNSTRLKRDALDQLDELAAVLKRFEHLDMAIVAYTSNENSDEEVNVLYTKAKAKNILDYLHRKGLAREKISSSGKGSSNPIAPNDTEEGREKNKRVEIIIFFDEDAPEQYELDSVKAEFNEE